ncbi:MAG TPA: YkvA family protein [Anaerolineales bacterium]|nr:YkvA family protein [Anaerolineales bacterium]
MRSRLAQRLQALKREAYALAIAARDPRLPWTARIVIALTLAHTFSPIDLIPDFIPVLGQLDDLVITPLGIALALRLTPPEILVEARARAEAEIARGKPVSRVGAALVILIWVALAIALLLAAIQTAARI